jgi:hypothetical protein
VDFLADLWDNIDRFTQVVGIRPQHRDQAEREVFRELFQAGPARRNDVLRVTALLLVWWQITGQPPRPRMVGGRLATRYLDLQRVNRLVSAEGRLAQALGGINIDALFDRHAWSELDPIVDRHGTGHLHVDLRAAMMTEVSRGASERNPAFYNKCYSHLLWWDTMHCYGLVAKVSKLVALSNMGAGVGHGNSLFMIASGRWLLRNRQSGIYQFYGIEQTPVRPTDASEGS